MKSFITVALLIFSLTISAQSETKTVKKRKEQLEKQDEVKAKKVEQGRQDGIERHQKMQTKETKKRMKKSKRKSKRMNDNRQAFFLVRWFS